MIRRGLLVLLGLLVPLVGFVAWSYLSIPLRNTDVGRFDTIIVLGVPSTADGGPAPEQVSRVSEGVREYKAGRAAHIIMSGGAAHNNFVEAESMARIAEAQGVPASAIEVEGQSQNTIQNLFYSWRMMQRHGWRSAEVVSSPSHLPRASLILSHYNGLGVRWATHAAGWPGEYPWWKVAVIFGYEAQGTTVLRWRGFVRSGFLPGS